MRRKVIDLIYWILIDRGMLFAVIAVLFVLLAFLVYVWKLSEGG